METEERRRRLSPEAPRRPWGNDRRLASDRPLVTVTALFVVSRIVYFVAGVRFDLSPLTGGRTTSAWQLLDTGLLEHHLIASVWELNSQPPLFNLFGGLLLKLPPAMQTPTAAGVFFGLGLIMVLSAFSVMVELRTPVWLSLVVTTFVVFNPSFILYENWFSYGYPCAALLTLAALGLARFVRTGRMAWGVALFAAASGTVLLDSSFQYPWIVGVIVVVVLVLRHHLRSVVLVAFVPVLAVGLWAVKDAVQFGTYTTSSWLGMNLTKTTLIPVEKANIAKLIRSHTLTPLAAVPAFSPVSVYVPRWAAQPHTGSAALDDPTKSNGAPNFNDLVYVEVSKRYLNDDLAFVRAHPALYLVGVEDAAKLATIPPDEYEFVSSNRSHIAGWARLYDATVLGQPADDLRPATAALYLAEGPVLSQLSYSFLIVLALVLLGSPVLAWHRRRSDRSSAATLVFIWFTVVYLLVTTSLIEFGENERYAADLGPLPVIAAAAVVAASARYLHHHRRPNERSAHAGPGGTGGGPSPATGSAATDPES